MPVAQVARRVVEQADDVGYDRLDAGRPAAAGPSSKLGRGEQHAPTLVNRQQHAHGGNHAGEACCGHDHTHSHDHTHTATGEFDPTALISARGLKVKRGERTILDAVDIDLAAGEIVTLIGPNGAGKTTLVRVLLGLEAPDGGRIARRGELRIGYVPQRFDIDRALPMTVERFLSLGLDVSREEVAAVLADVGAEAVIDRQLARLSGERASAWYWRGTVKAAKSPGSR